MRPAWWLALLVSPGVVAAAACTVGKNGLGPGGGDASTVDVANEPDVDVEAEAAGPDVVTEASPEYSCNAENCGGACCENQCVPRTCAGCATGSILCPYDLSLSGANGFCTTSCTACRSNGSQAGTTCYTCAGNLTLAGCAGNPSSCPQDLSSGACPCDVGDASTCPGADQSCVDAGGQSICVSH